MKSGRCCFSRLRARRRGISLRVNKANAMRKWDRNCGFARKMPLQNRTGGSNPSPSATQSGLLRNSGCIPARIAKNRRNSVIPSLKPDRRKCPAERHRQAMERLSLEGPCTVQFPRLHQANAMRSATDDSAKAT
jgi:hypothetical protein